MTALDAARLPGGILLHGPRGIGKATLAFDIAREVFAGTGDESREHIAAQVAADAVVVVVELLVLLEAAEVAEHILVVPLVIAADRRGPAIVVLALAAHVDHGVDGAAAAEGAAHGHDGSAAAELGLRHRLVHFEEGVLREVLHVSGGHGH